MSSFQVVALEGLPEIVSGHDLAAEIVAAHSEIHDGDIVVVSSKAVSKAEGRVVVGRSRERAVADETVRVVAEREDLKVVQTRHGLVLAAGGVDSSNVASDSLVLLPVDPDASARALRAVLQVRLGCTIGVIVTDTAGRPWRIGQTDIAIGAAGVDPLLDLRGSPDWHGRELIVTVPAVADEIAAAAELVMGKAAGTPVAVVRGLGHLVSDADGPGAVAIVRPRDEDLFPLGSFDVLRSRRTVREFTTEPVPRHLIAAAVLDAITAASPHDAAPVRIAAPHRFIIVTDSSRPSVIDAMTAESREDLPTDADPSLRDQPATITLLRNAPSLVVPCLADSASSGGRDEPESLAEQTSSLLAMGARMQNFLVSLSVHGLGAMWISPTLFADDSVRTALDLPTEWKPMGAMAIGYPAAVPTPHPPREVHDYLFDA